MKKYLLYRKERRIERVENFNGTTIHTHSYDLYIMMDRKVIENTIDEETRIINIKYYLDDEIYEEHRYIFINERIKNIVIEKTWESAVFEYRIFWRD